MRGDNQKKILILQHDIAEGPGLLRMLVKESGLVPEICHLYREQRIPSHFSDFCSIISLGGPMNVYECDRYPFLLDEEFVIREIIKKEIPFLGICLGAQMLAKACGARVIKGPKKEIGWGRVILTPHGLDDPLFEGFNREIPVFQWHGDTFEIPEGGVLLASSELYPHQAIRVGSNAYGIQFHLEITRDMVSEWIEGSREELIKDGIDPEIIEIETEVNIAIMEYWMRRFWKNFLKIVMLRVF
ncbi:MAG: type 1 glutamine amidotransferase [Candidatus Aenigmatarchaeota archaeon]